MIHIFCALPCEAQPLIQFFKLTEPKHFGLFRIFQSKDNEISLTITGMGKINTAASVSYHHACLNTLPSDIWLNIGVAGHESIDIGEICIVNKITDKQNNKTWYPQILFKAPCQSLELVTLDEPSSEYQNALFDMEASAFYEIASRLGKAELIHCLKVISDNEEQPDSKVNADKVKTIISKKLNIIEKLIEELKPFSIELRSITKVPAEYDFCMDKWHFTKSESIQLKRLLQQFTVRLPNADIINTITDNNSAKTVLTSLREAINSTEFVIHD